jgi:DnaJ-related protein SCJ1
MRGRVFSQNIPLIFRLLGFVQTIEGEGMPLFENPNLHGDLFVEYNVVLPVELSPHTRRSKSLLYVHMLVLTMSTELTEAFQSSDSRHDEL